MFNDTDTVKRKGKTLTEAWDFAKNPNIMSIRKIAVCKNTSTYIWRKVLIANETIFLSLCTFMHSDVCEFALHKNFPTLFVFFCEARRDELAGLIFFKLSRTPDAKLNSEIKKFSLRLFSVLLNRRSNPHCRFQLRQSSSQQKVSESLPISEDILKWHATKQGESIRRQF